MGQIKVKSTFIIPCHVLGLYMKVKLSYRDRDSSRLLLFVSNNNFVQVTKVVLLEQTQKFIDLYIIYTICVYQRVSKDVTETEIKP